MSIQCSSLLLFSLFFFTPFFASFTHATTLGACLRPNRTPFKITGNAVATVAAVAKLVLLQGAKSVIKSSTVCCLIKNPVNSVGTTPLANVRNSIKVFYDWSKQSETFILFGPCFEHQPTLSPTLQGLLAISPTNSTLNYCQQSHHTRLVTKPFH